MLIPKELIIQAKETLGDEAAKIIAKDLEISTFEVQDLKSCCPFHEEKSPSFIWSQKDFAYKCFGCGIRYGIIQGSTQHPGMCLMNGDKGYPHPSPKNVKGEWAYIVASYHSPNAGAMWFTAAGLQSMKRNLKASV